MCGGSVVCVSAFTVNEVVHSHIAIVPQHMICEQWRDFGGEIVEKECIKVVNGTRKAGAVFLFVPGIFSVTLGIIPDFAVGIVARRRKPKREVGAFCRFQRAGFYFCYFTAMPFGDAKRHSAGAT